MSTDFCSVNNFCIILAYPRFPTYYNVSNAFYNTYYNNRVASFHLAVLSVLGDIMYIRRREKHHHSLTSDHSSWNRLMKKIPMLSQ